MEWCYELMTYGIPIDSLPYTAEHKVKLKNHLEYLKLRQTYEDYRLKNPETATEMVYVPSNNDVLLGRGKPIQIFPGNIKLQRLVDSFLAQYHVSTKQQKTSLAEQIVAMTEEQGGRFLSKETGIWMRVSPAEARDKVSHVFRHRRNRVLDLGKEASKEEDSKRIPKVNAVEAGIEKESAPSSDVRRVRPRI